MTSHTFKGQSDLDFGLFEDRAWLACTFVRIQIARLQLGHARQCPRSNDKESKTPAPSTDIAPSRNNSARTQPTAITALAYVVLDSVHLQSRGRELSEWKLDIVVSSAVTGSLHASKSWLLCTAVNKDTGNSDLKAYIFVLTSKACLPTAAAQVLPSRYGARLSAGSRIRPNLELQWASTKKCTLEIRRKAD